MGSDHSRPKPKPKPKAPPQPRQNFFYEEAPESVYEEFEFIREELKHSKKVVRIYAFKKGKYPKNLSGIEIVKRRSFIDDFYKWSTDMKTNVPFISTIISLCQGELRDTYIKDGIEAASFVMLIFEKPMEIVGFASLIQNKSDKSILLHSICTKQKKGYGKILVNLIKDLAALIKVERVCLESVSSAIGFYKKLGFKESGELCKEYDDCAMVYTLSTG